MANREIGEIEIEIRGRTFLLRPSFKGLCEMEDRIGSIMECAKEMSQGSMKFRHLVGILYGGIVGALEPGQKPPVSFEELGQLCMEHGFTKLVPTVVIFFGSGLQGRGEEKKTEVPTPV